MLTALFALSAVAVCTSSGAALFGAALFADDTVPTTWIALGIAAVSMLGSLGAAVVAAIVKIAQIRGDKDTAALQEQNKTQAGQIATQAGKIAALEKDGEGCKAALAEAERKLEARDDKDRREMEVKIASLQSQLEAKSSPKQDSP